MAKQIRGDAAPPASPSAGSPAGGGLSMTDLGVVDGVGPAHLPRLDQRPAALLMCHPERWKIAGGTVVPLPARLPVVGGVACVEVVDPQTGALSLRLAKAEAERRGWQIIPLDVDGPGTSYIAAVPGLRGVYLTRWETAHAGSSAVTVDDAAFTAWLRSLVDRGIVRPPARYVLERMRGRLEQQRLELEDRVRTVPSCQVQLDRVLADLEVVERELDSKPLTPIAPRPAGISEIAEE